MLINEKTRTFIRQHANDDVRKLALQGTKDEDVDLTLALQQIAGWQTARRKLPTWATTEGIIYPPHLNMEQCSSEQTARYKADRVLGRMTDRGGTLVDLTGGFGVDFYWMSQGFRKRVYVEQSEVLCAIAEQNFGVLGLACSVCCCDTATYLKAMEPATVVFLDPARRDGYGGRTYSIEDCTPNVLELLPLLMQKADCVLLKLSPMLDWRKAVEDIQKQNANGGQRTAHVSEVHIVSVDNECKELLLVVGKEPLSELHLCCVNNDQHFQYFCPEQTGTFLGGNSDFPRSKLPVCPDTLKTALFLYEPNASIMKAGCFAELEQRFAVRQVASNSHLFLSDDEISDFPGRKFKILAVSSLNKQEINKKFSKSLKPMERANIAVRNFPLTAEQLRKKLKLKDGGDTYLFATTLADGQHRLFICRKIG